MPKRLLPILSALAAAWALGAGSAAARVGRPTPAPVAGGAIAGTVTGLGPTWVSIQTRGRRMGVVNALTRAADTLTAADLPYVWGGGHAEAGVASARAGARGRAARVVGFDCSGALAADLAGAGLWPPGSPVPNDAGVIAQLLSAGLIAPGPGHGPVEVTLYDDPGIHIFMNIDGRFFGTSDGAGGGSLRGGVGWLEDGAPDARSRAYRRYHLLPGVLRDSTSYGHTFTFDTSAQPALVTSTQLGDRITVTYRQAGTGALVATGLTYAGAVSLAGTVSALAPDGSSVTIVTATESTQTVAAANPDLTAGVELGDGITLTYTRSAAGATLRALRVTGAPLTAEASGIVLALDPSHASLSVQVSAGPPLTFDVSEDPGLLDGLMVGDRVDVSYVHAGPLLIAERIHGGSPPPPGH